MGREIAIAEPKPGLATERRQCLHERPGLAAASPAGLGIAEPGKGVHDGVEIGRNMQAEMHEIVPCVDAEDEVVWCEDPIESQGELRPADAAAEGKHLMSARDHRNRSSCFGRIRARAGDSGRLPQSNPCTSTAGWRSAA